MNDKHRIVSSESEELILVNRDDDEVGYITKAEAHDGAGVLHRAFSLFLFNAKGYISDGYIIDVESFHRIVKYNQHEDLNLMVGFGDLAGRWTVSLFARNLLEARPSYNAQYDVIPDGLAGSGDDTGVHLSQSSFTIYGLKFHYRMR